jgi:RIO kinase 1
LLAPETVLTGQVAADDRPADVDAVRREIARARKEEEERLRRQQEVAGPSAATWAYG